MNTSNNPFLEYTAEELFAILKDAGFDVEKTTGPGRVVFDSLKADTVQVPAKKISIPSESLEYSNTSTIYTLAA